MSAPSLGAVAMMSPHRNVLEADPETDESKEQLVDELQSRGRSCVAARQWMDAKLLYEKALSISTVTVDGKRKAMFYSNLSLVEKNMGKVEEARVAAEAATKEDEKNVKAYYRLGQALIALKRPDEALEALSKAKSLDPTNKALIKEHQKAQKQAEEKSKEGDIDAKADAAKNATETTSLPSSKTTTSTAIPTKKSNKKSDGENDNNDDDSKLFKKSEPIRGYKVVNGKKTSYFHNELDEKSKALIGDIAPKKIENPTTADQGNNKSKNQGTSQWNEAGTWEERDVTSWATDALTNSVLKSRYTLPSSSPAPSALVIVEKVTKVDGHASVAVVRGKTRFIYEFSVKLKWKLQKEYDDDEDLTCTGTFTIPDIDGTIALGEGYEIHDFNIDSVSDSSVKPVVDRFVHRSGFSEAINESIDNWVRLFRERHGAKSV